LASIELHEAQCCSKTKDTTVNQTPDLLVILIGFPGGFLGMLEIGAFQLGPKHSHGKKIKFPGYSIFKTWELCPTQIKDDSLVN
jgi:hypothetical protein